MAHIQGFTAPSTIRSSDQGFSAFETYGRRVAGQFDQPANDIREIGRSKAAVTSMLGRWPLNIIDLEQRAQAEVDRRNQAAGAPSSRSGGGGGGGGFHIARPERGSQSRGQGNQGSGAYDQMSEGAGRLGSMLGGMGGTMSPEYRRAIEAQQDRETQRYNNMINAANDKLWYKYQSDLNKYNENLQTRDQTPNQPVSTTNDPSSPYYDPGNFSYPPGTTGGIADTASSPGGVAEPSPYDYGGGGGWFSGNEPSPYANDPPYVSDQ